MKTTAQFHRPPSPGGTQLNEHVWFYRPPPGGEGTQLSEHVWFHRPPPGGVFSSVKMCGFIGRHPGGRVLSSVSMCGLIGRHPGGAPIHKLHGDVLPFRVCFFNRSHKQGFRLCLHGTSQEFHRSKVFFQRFTTGTCADQSSSA